LFDDISQDVLQSLTDKGLTIIQFKDFIQKGEQNLLPIPVDVLPSTPFTLCFTSGTTGDPKGAVQTHGNLVAITSMNTISFEDSDVHLSYLPLVFQ
jgi:long-chain acyl-CoA synthetase